MNDKKMFEVVTVEHPNPNNKYQVDDGEKIHDVVSTKELGVGDVVTGTIENGVLKVEQVELF